MCVTAKRALKPVWQNQLGGVTSSAGDLQIEWHPKHPDVDLLDGAERTRWAGRWVPCPEDLDAASILESLFGPGWTDPLASTPTASPRTTSSWSGTSCRGTSADPVASKTHP